ncbi:MAG: hypothetical protein U0835_06865 [Isosphaeraceae bacterium]
MGSVHPHELTYFNLLAGGREGMIRLADSNLDWGPGELRSLARMQAADPAARPDPVLLRDAGAHYGVAGVCHIVDAGTVHPGLPERLPSGRYVAVSASLQHGPWGPEGYFRALDGLRPVATTDDATIAVYRAADLPERVAARR